MLRIAGVQPLHPSRQIRIRGSNDEVIVRRHENERMARPVMARDYLVEKPQELAPVAVVAIDVLASHSSRRHVIDAAADL
jgi:hypothetical protein